MGDRVDVTVDGQSGRDVLPREQESRRVGKMPDVLHDAR